MEHGKHPTISSVAGHHHLSNAFIAIPTGIDSVDMARQYRNTSDCVCQGCGT